MTASTGQRRRTPRTTCRKGLHRFTEFNTIVDNRGGRRCAECQLTSRRKREAKIRTPHPRTSGWCKAGLHAWVPENWQIEASTGTVRCRTCRRAGRRRLARRSRRVPCVASGCRRQTIRSEGGTYICPLHRQKPPAWLAAAGLRVVGTQVVARL